eukprot:scaffold4442_cov125-Amphora_coffeaeformis.AAC.29
MGSALFEVGDVLGARGNIKAKKLRTGGTLFCRITPVPVVDMGHARLSMRCVNVNGGGLIRVGHHHTPSPFLEVSAQVQAAAGTSWQVLHRSPHQGHEPNAVWPAFDVDLCRLQRDNTNNSNNNQQQYQHVPLRMEVWDWQKNGKHKTLGRVETTLAAMMQIQNPQAMATNVDPDKIDVSNAFDLRVRDKIVGKLIVGKVEIIKPSGGGRGGATPAVAPRSESGVAPTGPSSSPFADALGPASPSAPTETTATGADKREANPPFVPAVPAPFVPPSAPSAPNFADLPIGNELPPAMAPLPQRPQFVDYISGGCELELCIAIDFTGSNGDPRIPGTLHYMNPNPAQLNDYEKALTAVGGIIAKYDTDQKFPVWGFGAKYGGAIQHCFRIGDAEELDGIHGVLQAYRNIFRTGLTMSGPTVFDQVIKVAAHRARTRHQQGLQVGTQAYRVLLILTDGAVTDVESTKLAIQEANDAPLSIVIVGIGDADFSEMRFLDDFQVNDIGGGRDICQFVEFRRYRNDRAGLTARTLEEIPDQLVDFFWTRGIMPMKSRNTSQLSLNNIEVEEPDAHNDVDLKVKMNEGGDLYFESYEGTFFDDTQWSATPQQQTYQPYQSQHHLPSQQPPYQPHHQQSYQQPYQSQHHLPSQQPPYQPHHQQPYQSHSPPAAAYGGSFPTHHPYAPSVAATPVQPPPHDIFYVQVPPGVSTGQQLRITNPMTQQQMIVTIPPGVPPGGKFGVRY